MVREFSVVVGIDAGRARTGAREFKAGADQVSRSSRKMDRSLRSTNRRAVALITTIGRLRGVATLAFSGFLGVGGLTAVTRTITQFQTEISRVNALLGDRGTTGVMNVLTERARELGATTIFTATQAAEGIRFLTLAGFDAAESYVAVESALNLAAAGMLDLGTSADLLSNIMSAFNQEAQDAADVADGLAIVAARSNTSIAQLGEAMKFVGPVAGDLGITVKDTAAALGILGNSGLQASLAGTGLRRIISGLLGPSKEAEQVFADLNVTQEELVGLLEGPDGIVNLVDRLAQAGIGATEAFTLFGVRGAPAFLSLLRQRDDLRKLTEQTRELSGEVERQARILADNLGGDGRAALSAVQEGILALGDAGLTQWLRDTVQGFTGFVRQLAGVKTAQDDLTDAMQKGIDVGKAFQDNWTLIKSIFFGLVAFMTRNLIPALLTSIGLLGKSFLAAIGKYIAAATAASTATGVWAAALRVFTGALVATGIGALLVGVGYLTQWAIEAFSAEEATKSLREEIEDMGVAAEEAGVRFDAFQGVERQRVFEQQRQRVVEAYEAINEAKSAIDALIDAQGRLNEEEAEFTEIKERNNQAIIDAGRYSMGYGSALGVQLMIANDTAEAEEGLNDTRETAKQSLIELQQQLADAESNYRTQIEQLQAMALVNQGYASSLEEAKRKLEELRKAEQERAATMREVLGIDENQKKSLDETIAKYDATAIQIAELEAQLELLKTVAGLSDAQLTALGTTQEQLARAAANAQEKLEELREQGLTPTERAAKEQAEAYQEIIDRLYPLQAATAEYQREALILIATIGTDTPEAAEKLRQALLRLRAEYDENTKKLREQCDTAKESAECQTEAAKRIEQIWDQAMRNIQDAFADFFRNGLDGFDDFADQLLDAFKDMIANMLAAWFTSGLQNIFNGQAFGAGGNSFPFQKIVDIFTGGGGGGAGGPGGGGFGGFGTLVKGLKNVANKFLSAAKAFGAGFKGFFTGQGISFGGGAAGGLGGVAAGGLTGLASGFAVDQILGSRGKQSTTNILSTAGGIIGGLIGGPIGALIGGAIGSFASNLFGGAKKLEKAVVNFSATQDGFLANLEKVVSKQRSFFRGRKFKTTIEDLDVSAFNEAFEGVIGAITAVGEQLGVDVEDALSSFTFDREINVKGKSEEEIAALLEDAFQDAVLSALRTFVNNAEGLSDRLRQTVRLFQGNAEEFIAAFEAAAAIDLALAINPVESVQEAIAESSKSLTQNYQELLGAYRELVSEYDGSLVALQTLSQATVILKDAQVQLAAALIAAGEEISATFQSSAQTVREALLSEEELYNLRRSQIDELVAQARETTDPAELRALAEEINRLGLDAFRLLDESQQGELGQEFIDFFTQLDELFGGQIQMGLDQVEEDSSAIDQEVATAMTDAAQAIIDAQREARDLYRDWRDWIREDRNRRRGEFRREMIA